MTNEIANYNDLEMRVKEDRPYITSLELAAKFEKEHRNILRAIQTLECSDEFNQLNFELVDYKDAKGEKRPMYRIYRDGFAFLAMGFTGEKAAAFKEKYIKLFNVMEKELIKIARNKVQTLWSDNRTIGVITRKEETDTIKMFVEYATGQGSSSATMYYPNLTNMTYKALELIKLKFHDDLGFRNTLDAVQLSYLMLAERIVIKALQDGIIEQLHYKEIYLLAKERVVTFANTLTRGQIAIRKNFSLNMLTKLETKEIGE